MKSRYKVDKNLFKKYQKTRLSQHKLFCKAPFTSLRFSLSGNVLACCFNRMHILGNIKENNLIEIWKGKPIADLQKQIKNKDLSYGCIYCFYQLACESFYGTGARNYDYLNSKQKKFPSMLDFEITNECNLECIMCNGENSHLIRKNREHGNPYEVVYDESFIEQLIPFIPHLEEARFVGGEPFLSKLNFQIWKKIIALNPKTKISILTNGTILTNEIKELLSTGNFDISMSIDSINKDSYEKIRKNARFETVMENFEYFFKYNISKGKIFHLNFCPIKENFKEIPEFIEFCNTRNIQLVFHNVFFPPGVSLMDASTIELNEMISSMNKVQLDSKSIIASQNNLLFHNLKKQIQNWAVNSEYWVKYYSLSANELHIILNNTITNFIEGLHIFSNDKTYSILNKLKAIIDEINDEILVKKSLINLLKMPVSIIVAEFDNSTHEKLIERFKEASK